MLNRVFPAQPAVVAVPAQPAKLCAGTNVHKVWAESLVLRISLHIPVDARRGLSSNGVENGDEWWTWTRQGDCFFLKISPCDVVEGHHELLKFHAWGSGETKGRSGKCQWLSWFNLPRFVELLLLQASTFPFFPTEVLYYLQNKTCPSPQLNWSMLINEQLGWAFFMVNVQVKTEKKSRKDGMEMDRLDRPMISPSLTSLRPYTEIEAQVV